MEAAAAENHDILSKKISENKAAAEEACNSSLQLSEEEQKYKHAMEQGKTPGSAQSKEAREFEKEFKKILLLNDSLKTEYEAAGKSYSKQREVKKKFAAHRFQSLSMAKTRAEVITDISSVDAEYCTFPRMWDREGRDAIGFRNAQNYANSAVQRWTRGETFFGHPYCKWDPDRQTGVILHKREKVSSTTADEYRLEQKEASEPASSVAGQLDPLTPIKRSILADTNPRSHKELKVSFEDQNEGEEEKKKKEHEEGQKKKEDEQAEKKKKEKEEQEKKKKEREALEKQKAKEKNRTSKTLGNCSEEVRRAENHDGHSVPSSGRCIAIYCIGC